MCTKGICPHIYLKMYALGIVIGRGADLDMYQLPSCSSFHANYHWAASSYLTTGNIHSCCFSMGSFISSHTNKCTNMHVLTHNHTFSFYPPPHPTPSYAGLFSPHTHTRMQAPLTHTQMHTHMHAHKHTHTHTHTHTALPKQSSEEVEPGAVVVVPSGQATHWVWRGSAL